MKMKIRKKAPYEVEEDDFVNDEEEETANDEEENAEDETAGVMTVQRKSQRTIKAPSRLNLFQKSKHELEYETHEATIIYQFVTTYSLQKGIKKFGGR